MLFSLFDVYIFKIKDPKKKKERRKKKEKEKSGGKEIEKMVFLWVE